MDIDKIITESIDNLVDEARRASRDPWASFEPVKTRVITPQGDAINVKDARGRGKKIVDTAIGRPEKEHKKREIAKDFFSANPNNASQIRRTLRKAWQPKLKPMYGLLGKFTGQYGQANAQGLLNLFGETDENGNPTTGLTTQYNIYFDKLDRYTSDIESYGADIWSIKSRLKQFPEILRDIVNLLFAMCKRCQKIKQLVNSRNVNPGFNRNIITGYLTSSGLNKKVIYKGLGSKEMNELTSYLTWLAEYIESISNTEQISMTDNLGIKQIRR
jgi:hypothetical protein